MPKQHKAATPKIFQGATLADFDRYMEKLLDYAGSFGGAKTMMLQPPMNEPMKPQLENEGTRPVRPHGIMGAASGSISTSLKDQLEQWEWDMKEYQAICNSNTRLLTQYRNDCIDYNKQIADDNQANSILAECFSESMMLNIKNAHRHAFHRIAALRAIFMNGTQNSLEDEIWDMQVTNLKCESPSNTQAVHKFISELIRLFQFKLNKTTEELVIRESLSRLCSKINLAQLSIKALDAFVTKIFVNNYTEFEPPLEVGAMPALPAPQIAPMVRSKDHYRKTMTTILLKLQELIQLELMREAGISANAAGSSVSTSKRALRAQRAKAKAAKSSSVDDVCTLHPNSSHSNAECRRQKTASKDHEKKHTRADSKSSSSHKDDAVTCRFCKKKGHLQKSCRQYKLAQTLSKADIRALAAQKGINIDAYSESDSESDGKSTAPAKKVTFNLAIPSSDTETDHFETCSSIVKALKAQTGNIVNIRVQAQQSLGLLDSGATVWMTPNRHAFSSLTYLHDGEYVELADSHTIPIKGVGDVSLVLQNGRIKVIHNALYVPDLADTLASVYSIIGDSGDIVIFTKDKVFLKHGDTEEIVTIGRREKGDLYYLYADTSTVKQHHQALLTSKKTKTTDRVSVQDVESVSMDSVSDVTSTHTKNDDDLILVHDSIHEDDVNGMCQSSSSSSLHNNKGAQQSLDEFALSGKTSMTVHELSRLHQQFGHIHLRTILKTAEKLNKKLPKIDKDAIDLVNHSIMENCLVCNRTKLRQSPIYGTDSPAPRILFRLHSDVVDLNIGKVKTYWQIIIDEKSRFITIYFLKRKSSAAESMIRHIADAENRMMHLKLQVAELRSDTGELITKRLINWCNLKIPRIRVNPSPASVKELNGLSERNIATIKEMSESMMLQAGLPRTTQFMQFAILYAATVKNVTFHSFTKEIPYVAYLDKVIDMAIIHAFGTLVSLWISNEQRTSRGTRDKSELGLFLGYKGEDLKIIIALNYRSRTIREYLHVTFHDGVFVGHNPSQQKLDDLTKSYPLTPGTYFEQKEVQAGTEKDVEVEQASISHQPILLNQVEEMDEDETITPFYYKLGEAGEQRTVDYDVQEHVNVYENAHNIDHFMDNYVEEDDSTYVPTVRSESEGLDEELVDGNETDAEADLHWIGEDAEDDWPGALAARRKIRKRKRAKNSNQAKDNVVEDSTLSLRTPRSIFTKSVPNIDWTLKAESSIPPIPIPNGNLRNAPKTLKEALSRPDELSFWLAGMFEEVSQLESTKTWEETSLPKGKNLLSGKWVFTYKLDEDGNITRFKARWVVRGFTQIEGVDFDETYSPVTKTTTIRILVALAALLSLFIHQFDIKGAYLNAKLEEENYMEMPHGFAKVDKDTNRSIICKLVKSLYGLHQAAREWYKTLWKMYESVGFIRNLADVCHFWRIGSENTREHTTVHVDDILFFSTSPTAYKRFKDELNQTFTVGSDSEAKWILKMQLLKTNVGYFLSNSLYVKTILEQAKLWGTDIKPAKTPMSSQYTHDKDSPLLNDIEATRYRSELMKISYVATKTRPDISYAVNILAQHLVDPHTTEAKALARLQRYLLGTWDYGLHYTRSGIQSPSALPNGVYEFASKHNPQGYSDADWAGEVKRFSRTGYVIMFANAAVSWQSIRQQAIASSSTEAELYALNELSREMKWMKNLMHGLGLFTKSPLRLWSDNQSTISIANNLFNNKKTKHIEVRERFVNLQIEQKEQEVQYIHTDSQTADIFTKALMKNKFTTHRAALGLVSQSVLTVIE